jgi:hypothetical protein
MTVKLDPNNKVKIRFTGLTGLLQNRDDMLITNPELAKERREDYIPYQERIWREKAHWNEETPRAVIFPTIWIRKMLIASQRQSGCPIKPPGSRGARDTLMKHFVGGIMLLNDPIVMLNGKPITDEVLVPFKKMVSPNEGKVLCIRPLIPAGWTVDVEIQILNEIINESHIIQCLEWAGVYNGCGDWRVEKGGQFGMFSIEKI